MKKKIKYISILFVDLVLSTVLIDAVMLGYVQHDTGPGTLQYRSFQKFAIDLTSITEDFSSVTVPQTETECSLPGGSLLSYETLVLAVKGRSPPVHPHRKAALQVYWA